ncbi:uncharacterized protein [Elaeis guineensis]|uniref:uncharacterized protein n=1 Tax=Elaeis guineensis var. tenera TaxID=51953 RepID=UPI00094F829A
MRRRHPHRLGDVITIHPVALVFLAQTHRKVTFQKKVPQIVEERGSVRRELTALIRMDTATRKRPGDGEEKKRRTRVREEEERDQSVTDDEVEEFFAILRRLREAARCFPVRDGDGGAGVQRRVAAEGQSTWRPRFEREDFEDGSNVRDDRRMRAAEEAASGGAAAAEERVAENAIPGRLDLNADPAPEEMDLGMPSGNSTAHVAS